MKLFILSFLAIRLFVAAESKDYSGDDFFAEKDSKEHLGRFRRQDLLFPDESESFDGYQGPCTTSEGGQGVCNLLSSCPPLQNNLDTVYPRICGFQQHEPIVCCPIAERVLHPSIPARTVVGQCGASENIADFDNHLPEKRKKGKVDKSDLITKWVVGGRDAKPASWPWMAAVGKIKANGKKLWFCGAVLINNRYVLTAAHCIADKPVMVRLGELDLSSNSDGSEAQEVAVQSTVRHPKFTYPSLYNDIALIRLAEPVKPSIYVRPVCLPPANLENMESRLVVLTGWGRTGFLSDTSDVLQEAQLQVLSQKDCKNNYDGIPQMALNFPKGIQGSQLCAGVPGGGKDACQGDSGGPLVYQHPKTKRYMLVGIVTGGLGCGFEKYPGIYVRVSNYVNWIKENIRS